MAPNPRRGKVHACRAGQPRRCCGAAGRVGRDGVCRPGRFSL